jgi:DNA polymerase III sliding clamp (beta) subunit (PCNA family)
LSFTEPSRPTVITPVIDQAEEGAPDSGDGSFRYLVMSMRLRG